MRSDTSATNSGVEVSVALSHWRTVCQRCLGWRNPLLGRRSDPAEWGACTFSKGCHLHLPTTTSINSHWRMESHENFRYPSTSHQNEMSWLQQMLSRLGSTREFLKRKTKKLKILTQLNPAITVIKGQINLVC